MEDKDSNTEFDSVKTYVVGHIVIRDADTGEIIVNQRDTMAQQSFVAETNNADNDE